MKNDDAQPELLTIPEAALKLRISERTIARLIADGQLYTPKIRLISAASIKRFLIDPQLILEKSI